MSEETCNCWRITRELDADEELPDHVCFEAARESVRDWADEHARNIESLLIDLRHGLDEAPVTTAVLSDYDRKLLGGIDNDFHLLLNRLSMYWPLRVNGLALGLVIRQWAQEKGSTTLANTLSGDRRWTHLEREFGQWLYVWRMGNSHRAEAAEAEWIERDGWSGRPAGRRGEDPLAARELSARLRQSGLPHTPATRKHLRAVAAGRNDLLPARGALITSRFYFAIDSDAGAWPRQSQDSVVDFPLTAAPLTLFVQVTKVIKQHRAFIQSAKAAGFDDHGKKRTFLFIDRQLSQAYKRKSYSPESPKGDDRWDPDHPWYDYLYQALKNLDKVANDASMHPDGPAGAISDHLKSINSRVYNRRRRAGLETSPPPNWTTLVRQEFWKISEAIRNNTE